MSAKDNLNEAMYSMFGVGKAPAEETPAEAAPQTTYTAPAAPRQDASVTYLAPGTVMEGTLKCKGDVHIAGDFKGDIQAGGKVTMRSSMEGNIAAANLQLSGCKLTGDVAVTGLVMLDPQASVEGKISAGELICAGHIKGDLVVKGNVSLKANTTVEGNITASTMTMEQGAIINGSLTMKPAAKAEPAKPEQSKK